MAPTSAGPADSPHRCNGRFLLCLSLSSRQSTATRDDLSSRPNSSNHHRSRAAPFLSRRRYHEPSISSNRVAIPRPPVGTVAQGSPEQVARNKRSCAGRLRITGLIRCPHGLMLTCESARLDVLGRLEVECGSSENSIGPKGWEVRRVAKSVCHLATPTSTIGLLR
jgi:hypothetical protein